MLQNQGIPASAAGVHTNGQAPVTKASRNINGRKLSRRLKKGLSPAFRALLAHELETGAVLHDLTRRQACKLLQVSPSYVATLAKIDPEQRAMIARGQLSLSAIHNKLTDTDIDRIVAKLGAERIMAAIDRYTQPQFKFAAE